jgi:hypothetical protein
MAELRSGIFTLREFVNRNVLKLAPDGFITINGSLGSRVIVPVETGSNGEAVTKDLDVRGGVSSIGVTGAVSPPGANRASIEVIAPQHKGLHEDYYVTLPTGVRVPFFAPMMEVKIYMKGRFLDAADGYVPKYYPVFWGFINEISENYSGGVHTFSINCSDMLTWWKYQKITLRPSAFNTYFGAPLAKNVPTVFENLNPWQIIVALFNDTYFLSENRAYNFVYPKFSKAGYLPDLGRNTQNIGTLFGGLAQEAIQYWNQRFGFLMSNASDQGERIPLEIFSLRGRTIDYKSIDLSNFRNSPGIEKKDSYSAKLYADLDLDYNMLARIMPFGQLSLYGDSSESLEMTKLEIANAICEQTHLEFFTDMNGSFVFKPPFYNMDTLTGDVPYYNIKSSEIINFNSTVNSDNLITFLEVTSPQRYDQPELELIGFHIDFDLLKRFGLRHESVALRYGNDARTLRLLAAAEMTRINGRAYTGTTSIPLRPEIRLGYPVYVDHLDAYFYVTGISHNITFGSSASTDLSLEFRRDRVFDPDGSIGKGPEPSYSGKILKGYVYRFTDSLNINDPTQAPADSALKAQVQLQRAQENLVNARDESAAEDLNREIRQLQNTILKDSLQRANDVISGPKTTGFYNVDLAQKRALTIENSGTPDAIVSNEVLMITDDTVPYTDINGYRHIGAFPYGANLKLSRGGVSDTFDRAEVEDAKVSSIVKAGSFKEITSNIYRTNEDESIYQFGVEGLDVIQGKPREQLIKEQQESVGNAERAGEESVKVRPEFENDPSYNPNKQLPPDKTAEVIVNSKPRNTGTTTVGTEAGNQEQPLSNTLSIFQGPNNTGFIE